MNLNKIDAFIDQLSDVREDLHKSKADVPETAKDMARAAIRRLEEARLLIKYEIHCIEEEIMFK